MSLSSKILIHFDTNTTRIYQFSNNKLKLLKHHTIFFNETFVNSKMLGKLRDNEKINNEFINLRLNAFNAHLCHSNAKKYYINLLKHYKFKIKK